MSARCVQVLSTCQSHRQCCVLVGVCRRRWLPRRKLDPLGIDAQLDGIKLTANNKANVCAAVQRAYDRAREEMSSVPAAAAAGGSLHSETASTEEL